MKKHRSFAFVVTLSTALSFAAIGALPRGVAAQATNPDSARLFTRDIANFWRAIDAAPGKDTAALIAPIRDRYLAHPSPGMLDWIR